MNPPRTPTAPFVLTGLLVSTCAISAGSTPGASGSATNLFQMDLEALMDVRLKGVAGLTEVDRRRAAVPLTTLTAQDIDQSGARDLNHLLEIYVPNLQFIDHHHLQAHLGLRGIISDREDKYLYQVNGRTMNNRLLLGADNERAIPLMGDIRSVDVVRGPASATHGAGALAGVIDVETFNGLTYQGLDLKVRQGAIDEYTAAEARYGKKLSETSGLFFYYGLADVDGANSDYYIGRSYPAANGLPANVAGEPLAASAAKLNEPGFDELKHKAYLSYVAGPFELWTRFVQDGGQDRPMREIYSAAKPADVSVDEWTRGRQFCNKQFTLTGRYRQDLSPSWKLDVMQSYDMWDLEDQRAGVYRLPIRKGQEHEVFSRAIATWTPVEAHSIAFGSEYSHEWFHNPSYSDALDRAPVVLDRDWQTDTVSLLAEHQWRMSDTWTTFLSFRTDKHTYSDWLLSPRATLVFTPTERDTFKLMAGQSVRRGGDEELWAQWSRQGTIPNPETLRSYDLSYERKLGEHWTLGGNLFYEDYDAIGWIPSLYYSSSVGRYQVAGGELQLGYTTGSTRVTLSQGLAKLVNASLPGNLPAGGEAITAEPYGYGNDLAEWAPGITKLAIVQELSKKWTASSSLVYYSGFPGGKDFANYAATFANAPSAMPLSDPGYDKPYGPNLYVNLGLEFRPTDKWTLRVDGYNLAALADETLSKRNYYFRLSEFSVQPAAASVSARYRF